MKGNLKSNSWKTISESSVKEILQKGRALITQSLVFWAEFR